MDLYLKLSLGNYSEGINIFVNHRLSEVLHECDTHIIIEMLHLFWVRYFLSKEWNFTFLIHTEMLCGGMKI